MSSVSFGQNQQTINSMKTAIEPKTCAECGAEFLPKTSKGASRALYCRPLCRTRHGKRCADLREGQRHRSCVGCGQDFGYFVGRGKDRMFCSDPICRATRLRTLNGGKPLCVTEGCQNRRGYRTGLCNTCYIRIRRAGKPEPPARHYAYRSKHSSGYIVIIDAAHPLAVRGRVFEHRKVLFASIGPGQHPCHWCATPVEWMKKGTAKRGSLVADHLDGDKANNLITNLVPSCARCNWSRGLLMSWVSKHKDDPVLWQMYMDSRQRTA